MNRAGTRRGSNAYWRASPPDRPRRHASSAPPPPLPLPWISALRGLRIQPAGALPLPLRLLEIQAREFRVRTTMQFYGVDRETAEQIDGRTRPRAGQHGRTPEEVGKQIGVAFRSTCPRFRVSLGRLAHGAVTDVHLLDSTRNARAPVRRGGQQPRLPAWRGNPKRPRLCRREALTSRPPRTPRTPRRPRLAAGGGSSRRGCRPAAPC